MIAKHFRIMAFLIGLVFILTNFPPTQARAAVDLDVSHFSLRVGNAIRVMGPRSDIPDSPFVAFNTGSGIRGYIANSTTYRLDGPDMEHLTLNTSNPVISKGPSGNLHGFKSRS